jgi:hypothetical protein
MIKLKSVYIKKPVRYFFQKSPIYKNVKDCIYKKMHKTGIDTKFNNLNFNMHGDSQVSNLNAEFKNWRNKMNYNRYI